MATRKRIVNATRSKNRHSRTRARQDTFLLAFAEAANSYPAVLLDLDGRDATSRLIEAIAGKNLPEPSWSVYRETSGGTHAAWCLESPVHRGEHARLHPLTYLARCSEWMLHVSGADPSYSGVLSHNPYAPGPGLSTTWGRCEPYSLAELAESIPRGWRRPRVAWSAIGRNADLFRACMKWAGSPANLGRSVLHEAIRLNATTDHPAGPLDWCEVKATAKSIERYRCQWEAAGRFYSEAERSEHGRRRGLASGKARRQRTATRDTAIVDAVLGGESMRSVAKRLGIKSKETVRHIVERDAPMPWLCLQRERAAARAPWVAAGVSRRTWYRRGGTSGQ